MLHCSIPLKLRNPLLILIATLGILSLSLPSANASINPLTTQEVQNVVTNDVPGWKSNLPSQRPRLLLTKQEYNALPARYANATGRELELFEALIAQADFIMTKDFEWYYADRTVAEQMERYSITEFAAREELWIRQVGDDLITLTVAAQITNDASYKNRIKAIIAEAVDYDSWGEPHPYVNLAAGHLSLGMSLAYDWHYDFFTEPEKGDIRDAITVRVGQIYSAFFASNSWVVNIESNHNHVAAAGAGYAGLAFMEEISAADYWSAAAYLNFERVVDLNNADGSMTEGVSYWSYGVSRIFQYIDGISHVIPTNSFYNSDFYKNGGHFRLHSATSGYGAALSFGHAVEKDYVGPHHILYRLASEHNNTVAQYLADNLPFEPQGNGPAKAFAVLWYTSSIEATPPSTLDNHLPVADIVTMRSGWSDNDYLLAIKSGFTNRSHSHLDAGAITWAVGSEWMIDTPGYGDMTGQSSFWKRYPGTSEEGAWDYFSNATESHSTLLVNGKNQLHTETSRSTVVDFLSTPTMGLANIDMLEAYEDVSQIKRAILHRRGDYALVWDTVQAPSTATVEWLLKMPEAGYTVGHKAYISGASRGLEVRCLYPTDANFYDRQHDSLYMDLNDPGRRQVAAIEQEGTEVNFLVALLPNTYGQPDSVHAITTNSSQGVQRANISGNHWEDRVLLAESTSTTPVRGVLRLNTFTPIASAENLLSQDISNSAIGFSAQAANVRFINGRPDTALFCDATEINMPGWKFALASPTSLSLRNINSSSCIVTVAEPGAIVIQTTPGYAFTSLADDAVVSGELAPGDYLLSVPDLQTGGVTNYVWNNGTTGSWTNNSGWSPNPTATVGPAGQAIGHDAWVNPTRYDRVTLDGITINTPGSYANFYFANSGLLNGVDKTGTYNALTLINGSILTLEKMRISSTVHAGAPSYADGAYIRGAYIDASSSLVLTGELRTGVQEENYSHEQGTVHQSSIWQIEGEVEVGSFSGEQAPDNAEATGGFILNIDGGNLMVSGNFNWNYYGQDLLSNDTTAHVNLSNGGTFHAATMSNIDDSDNACINFLDATGTATFSSSAFANSAAIEQLITQGHIRKDASLEDAEFVIEQVSSNWVITLTEPITNYQWADGSLGDWEDNSGWSPDPLPAIGGSWRWIGRVANDNFTRFDRVTLDGVIMNNPSTDVKFYTWGDDATKTGTATAITLLNSSQLTLGDIQISSALTSTGGYIRNAYIEEGSSLTATEIITGAQNWTNHTSTWHIAGDVAASAFKGLLGDTSTNGGYILNIDGGSLTITGDFDWNSNETNTTGTATAQINLSNGGTFYAGTMSDIEDSDNAYINFVDASGSVTFGGSAFANATAIEQLITDEHIRKDESLYNKLFLIEQDGSDWKVTLTDSVTHYKWAGNATDNWNNNTGWSPAATDSTINYMASTSWTNMTRFDRVTLDGASLSNNQSDVAFMFANRWDLDDISNKIGTYVSLTLLNGSYLNLRNLRVSSAVHSGGHPLIDGEYIRGVYIDASSSIQIENAIQTGVRDAPGTDLTQGAVHQSTIWQIEGEVEAEDFMGEQASGDANSTGGFVLNIDGGSFTITGDFDWNHYGQAVLSDKTTAHVNLSNGGTFSVNTMSNIEDSDNAYINFVDPTGIVNFDSEAFANSAAIEQLIIDGHIRLNGKVVSPSDIDITDAGSGWSVSQKPLPAATTTAPVIHYRWNEITSNGDWANPHSWNPYVTEEALGYSTSSAYLGNQGGENLTRHDRVSIDGNTTINSTSAKVGFFSSYWQDEFELSSKTGNFHALSLTNGASLTLRELQVSSSTQTFGSNTYQYTRNVYIDASSELNVMNTWGSGQIVTGAQDHTNNLSTWTILGDVTTVDFYGQQSGGNNTTGGYVLNIDGGSLNVSGEFNWRSSIANMFNTSEQITPISPTGTAQVNLSNGASVVVGTMNPNWSTSPNAFIDFLDASSTLTFSNQNFATLASVQQLVANGQIRKGGEIVTASDFSIVADGSDWVITVNTNPTSNQVINYQWTGSGTGNDWRDGAFDPNNTNWAPTLPFTMGAWIHIGNNWSSEHTRHDRVTLDGDLNINGSRRQVGFYHSYWLSPSEKTGLYSTKEGEFNALTLLNGADVSFQQFQVSSGTEVVSSVEYNFTRNVYIDANSSLVAADAYDENDILTDEGLILTGALDETDNVSTWWIHGHVSTTNFYGQQAEGNGNTGGYILNIDGGSLHVSGEFKWSTSMLTLFTSSTISPISNTGTAQVNLSNGGQFVVGSMDTTGLASSNAFINIMDPTASFVINDSSPSSEALIEDLIDNGNIRIYGLQASVEDFSLSDEHGVWKLQPKNDFNMYGWPGDLSAGAAFPSSAGAIDQYISNLRPQHPRLFINSEMIPALRARAYDEEYSRFTQLKTAVDQLPTTPSTTPIHAFTLDGNGHIIESSMSPPTMKAKDLFAHDGGKQAMQAALVYLITEDTQYLDKAKTYLEHFIYILEFSADKELWMDLKGESRINAMTAYDWIYNDLTQSEREDFILPLLDYMESAQHVNDGGTFTFRRSYGDETNGNYGEDALRYFGGLVAYGDGFDDTLARDFLRSGIDQYIGMMDYRDSISDGSGLLSAATPGYSFGNYPYATFLFLHSWEAAFGDDISHHWSQMTNYATWFDFATINQGAGQSFLSFGVGDTYHDGNVISAWEMYTHLAQVIHFYAENHPDMAEQTYELMSTLPTQYMDFTGDYPFLPYLVTNFSASHIAEADAGLLIEPRYFYNKPFGLLHMRSGKGLDDTYASFRFGSSQGNHQHYDELSFVIYKKGFLALDAGSRNDYTDHHHAFAPQSVAHNTILIHQDEEDLPFFWTNVSYVPDSTTYYNHGGQNSTTEAEAVSLQSTEHFIYAAGDATKSYHSEKAEEVVRQFVYIKPDFFIVYDRVKSVQLDQEKEFIMHFSHQPQLIDSDPYPVHQADDGGRLFLTTLLPDNASINTEGGAGREFWASGKNWPLDGGSNWASTYTTAGGWRLEISNPLPQKQNHFLHFIEVDEGQSTTPISPEYISTATQDGLKFTDPNTGDEWKILFNRSGEIAAHIQQTSSAGEVLFNEDLFPRYYETPQDQLPDYQRDSVSTPWKSALSTAPNIYYSSSLGFLYNNPAQSMWTFSYNFGWLWPVGDYEPDLWLYSDEQQDWIYLNANYEGLSYRYNTETWYYYDDEANTFTPID